MPLINEDFDRGLEDLVNVAVAEGFSSVRVASALASFAADIVMQDGGSEMVREWIEGVAVAVHHAAPPERQGEISSKGPSR